MGSGNTATDFSSRLKKELVALALIITAAFENDILFGFPVEPEVFTKIDTLELNNSPANSSAKAAFSLAKEGFSDRISCFV